MRLLSLHRVVIACAIALGMMFCAWSTWQYRQAHEPRSLLLGALAALIAIGLAAYWRTIPSRIDSTKR